MGDKESLNNKPFEEILMQLEAHVNRLESGDVPVEEALLLFEEGVRLSSTLNARLAGLEQRILKLTRDENGKLKIGEFEASKDDH
jgi:exodeoxyribonuclease VII small subunit